MGSSVSSSKFGHLYLKLEKGFFYPGETVTGNIYVSLIQNYPGCTINLRITGNEEAHWSEQRSGTRSANGKSQTYHYTEYYSGSRQILQHRFPVYSFPQGWIPQGQYAIPVCFRLPEYIPGSFVKNSLSITAKISYQIEAEILSLDRGVSNMVFYQPITIRECVKETIHSLRCEMNINVKTWCCIGHGNANVRAYFEKNAYAPYEVANVICEIDNTKCDIDLSDIQFVLINRQRFVCSTGHSKQLSEDVTKMIQNGLKAKEAAVGENRRVFSMAIARPGSNYEMQPSTEGQLISNKYFLRINATPNGCVCCSTIPHVEVPINIYAPQQILPIVEAPQGWNPTTMPVANLTITDAFLFVSQEPTGNLAPPSDQQNFNQGGFGTNPSQAAIGQNPVNNNYGGFGQTPSSQSGFGQNPSSQGGFGQNPSNQGGFGYNPSQNQGNMAQPPQPGGFGENPSQGNYVYGFGQNAGGNNQS